MVAFGVLILILGILLILFRKPFARLSVAQQKALWGFRWGEREVRWTELSLILIGVCALIFGIFALTGILPRGRPR
jgi:hypothetical protein